MSENSIINIIGAGLSGLAAAKTFAEAGKSVRLISAQPSERAQSVLAEGGINGALNVMGEEDSTDGHFQDTLSGGVFLADPDMVRGLVDAAPGIIYELERLGVPFHREGGTIVQRSFGGQKKKRTAYAMSSTGKMLTTALIDCVRRYEAEGLVMRYFHHRFERLMITKSSDGIPACLGAQVLDINTRESLCLYGPVLMAVGGMNGFFRGVTTGTTANTGTAAAQLFFQGVRMANLEFLQYHPTTVAIPDKRMLISEAARGEGGRLFCEKEASPDGETLNSRYYFMEEKYGEGGNLKPRDVISREMAMLGRQAYLDLTGLPMETWKNKLADLREEIIHYLSIDPAAEPVPVSPGIHYFMGGILVDKKHKTNITGLYASGECACAYHGANRLGGNSLLGAIYGGRTAAGFMMEDPFCCGRENANMEERSFHVDEAEKTAGPQKDITSAGINGKSYVFMTEREKQYEDRMVTILTNGLGVLREGSKLVKTLDDLNALKKETETDQDAVSDELQVRIELARAMVLSAVMRKESRGAHTRADFPEKDDAYRKTTAADYENGQIKISFIPVS